MGEKPNRKLETLGKALKRYRYVVEHPVDDEEIQSLALMQIFGLCFDYAWKSVQDLLKSQGVDVTAQGPKGIFSLGYEAGIVQNEAMWRNLVEDRNYSTHVYEEEKVAEIAERASGQYLTAFESLYKTLIAIDESS